MPEDTTNDAVPMGDQNPGSDMNPPMDDASDEGEEDMDGEDAGDDDLEEEPAM